MCLIEIGLFGTFLAISGCQPTATPTPEPIDSTQSKMSQHEPPVDTHPTEAERNSHNVVVEMVSVPTTTFPIGQGSADNSYSSASPEHQVTVAAYQIGKFEVTNKQYCEVLNWALAQGCLRTGSNTAWSGTGDIYAGDNLQLILRLSDGQCDIQNKNGVFSSKTRTGLPVTTTYSMERHPVGDVTWYGAVAFCNWLNQMQGLPACYDMSSENWPLGQVAA